MKYRIFALGAGEKMRTVGILKVVCYPAFAVLQIVLFRDWFGALIAVGLVWIAGLNLSQLLSEKRHAH
jgi:hypothetical protein